VRQWKQRGMGALAVIGIGGAAIGGVTVWFWGQMILQALRGG
jgi:succinyl-CoA synthetase alpha subunit